MNRVAIVAAACAAGCSAVPAQAVFLNFTVNASGTRYDAVLVAANAPNPPGTTLCLGVVGMERICQIGDSPFRSFDFAQEFTFTGPLLLYDQGNAATTGRTQFTLTDLGNNTYGLTLFRFSLDTRVNGVGRVESLVQTGLPLVITGPRAVPEPATWATMIAGFGAIGGAMRARRRVRASVAFG